MRLAWSYVDSANLEAGYRTVCYNRSGSQYFLVVWQLFGKRLYACFDL
jgi:hypothetical protein